MVKEFDFFFFQHGKSCIKMQLDYRHVEMENILGGLGVYRKKLVKLVSLLRRLFNWNRLKSPEILNKVEVVNANSRHR